MDLNVPSASQCHLTTERETAGWETWGEGGGMPLTTKYSNWTSKYQTTRPNQTLRANASSWKSPPSFSSAPVTKQKAHLHQAPVRKPARPTLVVHPNFKSDMILSRLHFTWPRTERPASSLDVRPPLQSYQAQRRSDVFGDHALAETHTSSSLDVEP